MSASAAIRCNRIQKAVAALLQARKLGEQLIVGEAVEDGAPLRPHPASMREN